VQNIRGGRVKLSGIVSPEMEYNHPEKGDALHAMELALSLEVCPLPFFPPAHAQTEKGWRVCVQHRNACLVLQGHSRMFTERCMRLSLQSSHWRLWRKVKINQRNG